MNVLSAGVGYLRKIFAPVAPLACLDVQSAAAAGAATLHAATATVTTATELTAADLVSGGKTALASCPRQLRFTVAGTTPADAPASATIKGYTLDGPIEETVTLPQTATTVDSAYYYTRIDSITQPAGDGTDATVAIGFTANLGLPAKLKGRGASSAVVPIILERVDGAAPTAGALIVATTAKPYGAYTADATAAPNASRDHLVYFELDA